jgi:hypothetical protein
MNPLVLEVMRSVSTMESLLFRFVAVRSVLLVTVAHQKPDAGLFAVLK